jgi:hypothetical protein
MTKHMLEKLPAACQSETDRDCMRVMAGHPKGDYFNEISLTQLPHEAEHCVRLLLPNYSDWLRQRESPNGDKTDCCTTFLLCVLPHLVQVAVQCGVFFYRGVSTSLDDDAFKGKSRSVKVKIAIEFGS